MEIILKNYYWELNGFYRLRRLRVGILLSFVFCVHYSNAQYTISAQSNSSAKRIVLCGRPDTFQFTLTNTSGSLIVNDSIMFSFPNGVDLISVLPSSGYSAAAKGIFISSLNNNASIVVKYLLKANCSAVSLGSCIPIYRSVFTSQVIYGLDYISSISIPLLQLSSTKKDTTNVGQGSVYTRIYTVSNSSSDALSYLSAIAFRSILQKGLSLVELKIANTVVTPTISGDTIRYLLNGQQLDTDSLLHGGQSVLIYEKVRVSNICQIQNTQYSAINATWGCNNSSCEIKTLNAIAQKGTLAPDMFYAPAVRIGSLLKCSNYDTFVYKYYNRGSSTAYGITGGSGIYSGDAKAIYSEALAESLVSFDNGNSFENTRVSSRIVSNPRAALNYGQLTPLYSSGQYPPTPDSIMSSNFFTIDSLNPGDTVRVMILVRRLCPSNVLNVCGRNDQWGNSKDYVSAFTYQIYETPYKDYCGVSLFNDWIPGGAPSYANSRLLANWQIALFQQPTDVMADTIFTTGIENMSNYIDVSSTVRTDSNWFYMLELGLSSTVRPRLGATKADFWHKASAGASHGICDSFHYDSTTNKLRIFFYRNRWDAGGRLLRAGSMYAKLVAKCSGSGSISTAISYRGYFFNSCGSCGLNQASCIYSQPLRIHCSLLKSSGGIDFKSYDYRRTQFGLEDYNDDGYPDGVKRARRDSVFDRRVIPGDTIEFNFGGMVYNVSTNQYPNAFAYNTFIKTDLVRNWGSLTNYGGTLFIKNSSGTYSTNLIPTIITNASNDTMSYKFNISQDSIKGKGSIPSNYVFTNGDSIWIKSRYRFLDNPEHPSVYYSIIPFFVRNHLFLTAASNPNPYKTSDTAAIESNDEWFGKIEVVFVYSGYRFTTWLNPNVCGSYTWSTSTWGEVAGFAPWSYSNFKNEIRPYVNIFSLYHKIPSGWALDTSAGVYLNAANGYSVPNFRMVYGFHYILNSVTQEISINLRKVLDDQYGNGFLFDEARHHNIVMGLKKCKSASSNPLNNTPNGLDSFIVNYTYPDISLTGATNSLASGFNIINSGANITTLASGAYQINDNEPKIGIQVIGSNDLLTSSKNFTVDVKLINERYNATYALSAQNTWLKIDSKNAEVTVDSIQNLSSSLWLKPDSLGLYRTGGLNILEERQFRLAMTSKACYSKDTIDMRVSYSCSCGKASDTGFAQSNTSIFLSRRTPDITLSTKAIPSDTFKLCDTIEVQTVIKNSGLSKVYNFGLNFKLPNFGNGLTIVPGSVKFKFPLSSAGLTNVTNLKYLGSGNYRIDSIQNYFSTILNNGLSEFTDTQNNRILLKYKMVTNCDFQSGDNIESQVFEVCGYKSYLNNSVPLRLTSETKIQNNLYFVNAQFSPVVSQCKNFNVELNFTNLTASVSPTSNSDSLYFDLPFGIQHANSSINPDRIEQLVDGRYRIRWSVKNINPGGSKSITTTLKFDPLAGYCGMNEFSLRAISSILDTCTTTGATCNIAVLKYRHNFEIDFQKSNLILQNVSANTISDTNNIDVENTTINFTIDNTGDSSSSQSINVYFDANANNVLDPADSLLVTSTSNTLIPPSTSSNRSLSFVSTSKYSCPLIVRLDTSNNCICNSSSQSSLRNIPLSNAGKDRFVCSGIMDSIGIKNTTTSTYQWLPSGGLSSPNSNRTAVYKVNNSGIDSSFEYVLKTTRGGGVCISSDTALVTVFYVPVISKSRDTNICKGEPVDLYVSGGTSYSWNSVPAKFTALISESPSQSYLYKVTSTDGRGCSKVDSILVSIDSILLTTFPRNLSICINDSVKIGTTANANQSYLWSPIAFLSSAVIGDPLFKGSVVGSYTYIAKVSSTLNNCQHHDTVNIVVNDLPIANAGVDLTRVNCLGDSVRLGSNFTPSYSYLWTPSTFLSGASLSNPTSKPSIPIAYSLQVTDNSTNCKNFDTVFVNVIESILKGTKKVDHLKCFNDRSGKIALLADSGHTPYSFRLNTSSWQSAGNFTSLGAGNYQYEIKDIKGCVFSDTISVNQPEDLLVKTINKKNVSCYGGTNGEIELEVVGGVPSYTYLWNNLVDTTPKAIHLNMGNYKISITDKNGCVKFWSEYLTEPNPILVLSNKKYNLCFGDNHGELSLDVKGGSPPYTYQWNTNESKNSIKNLVSGIYTCSIQDNNSCMERFVDSIVDPLKLVFDSIQIVPMKCKERPEGAIKAIASGGTGKLLYRIDSTKKYAVDNRFDDLGEGKYNVMVEDENHCMVDSVVSLNSIVKFDIAVTPKDTTIQLNHKIALGFKVLEGDSSSITALRWSPSYGLSCADCAQPEVNSYVGNLYTLEVYYHSDCILRDTADVKVFGDQEIFIPTAFYPSSLYSENTTFKIYSNNVAFAELKIFNRWGEKVFSTKHANLEGWDGMYKSEECMPGIYTYTLMIQYLNKIRIEKKGSFILIR